MITLMATQLILNILYKQSFGLQVLTFCFPHPTALNTASTQYSPEEGL